jgi:ABC-type nitrate/sulfonate/bicarbonate transport system substrate-binding protein
MSIRMRLALLLCSCLALLVACAPAAQQAATTSSPIKLSLGRGTGAAASALLILADEQGYLKAQGLDVTIRDFPSNADAASALVAGDIQGAIPSATIVNSLLGRAVDFKILAAVSRSPRDAKVIVAADINKPEDLKGKKVAMVAGSSSEMVIGLYLKRGGLTLNDVEVIKADAPEIVAIMSRGEAQAFDLWEPFPTRTLELMGNKAKIAGVSEDFGVQATLHQIMSGQFLASNPDAGVRLMKAYLQAEKFYKDSPQQSVEILAKRNNLSVDDARTQLANSVFAVAADDAMLGELKTDAQWQVEIGRLKEIPDYSKALDTSFLKQADPSRVTLKS